MSENSSPTRRDALKAAAGVGMVALAGCAGDDGDAVDINVGSSDSGSSTYSNSQAIQRAVNQESDTVNFITVDAGGDPQSIRLYEDDEINAYSAGGFIFDQAMNDQGPFEDEPVETFPLYGFSHLSLNLYWIALEDSDIETTDDLFGADIWPLPGGWGLRDLTETMYGEAGLWDDLEPGSQEFETGEAASALEEGRVEALVAYNSNFDSLPTWAEEVDARNDVRLVEMTDEFAQAAENFGGAGYEELGESIGDPWDQDIGTDGSAGHTWTETYPYLFHPDIPAESVYEVMDIIHNNPQEVLDANPAALDYSDLDNYTFSFLHTDRVDVHPGAADWLEEHDLWDDDWSRPD